MCVYVSRMFAFTKHHLLLCLFLLKIHSKRWKILRAICGGGVAVSVRIEKEIKLGWVTLRDNSSWNFCVSSHAECFPLKPNDESSMFYWWKGFNNIQNVYDEKNIFVAWGFRFSSAMLRYKRHFATWKFFKARDKQRLKTYTRFHVKHFICLGLKIFYFLKTKTSQIATLKVQVHQTKKNLPSHQ